MNRLFTISLICLFSIRAAMAQRLVYDRQHFAVINENGAMRLAAENTHNNYLGTINQRLDDIDLNVASVVMVQQLIYNSLSQVNQALKSGLTVMQVGSISNEIITECSRMVEVARHNPILLLFAEDVARQLKVRGVNLVGEVSSFVLKEGQNILMDYEKRDALLSKVVLELRVMRALCYSMARSMYWAKANGLFKTADPYQGFINQDVRKVNEIISSYKLLKN